MEKLHDSRRMLHLFVWQPESVSTDVFGYRIKSHQLPVIGEVEREKVECGSRILVTVMNIIVKCDHPVEKKDSRDQNGLLIESLDLLLRKREESKVEDHPSYEKGTGKPNSHVCTWVCDV